MELAVGWRDGRSCASPARVERRATESGVEVKGECKAGATSRVGEGRAMDLRVRRELLCKGGGLLTCGSGQCRGETRTMPEKIGWVGP